MVVGVEFLWKVAGSSLSVDGYIIRVPAEFVSHVENDCEYSVYMGKKIYLLGRVIGIDTLGKKMN